jgi:uncharacterized protein (DUF2336 family)
MPITRPQIEELDHALASTPCYKHSTILSRVTDLFLHGAKNYSRDHVAIFDHVIGFLIEKIDPAALVELSNRLVDIDNAPPNVVGRLAHHEDIDISGPLLERSNVLTDKVLVEIIMSTKAQNLLAMIASRAELSEPVADALVERGNSDTILKVIHNAGARLSELGFAKVINRAGSDKAIATAVASRKDLPAELQPFLKLALE